jgi:trimeric autotransporter adhesin
VALGYDALRNLNPGSSNIAIGRAAGEDVTGGSFNIFIGNDGDGVAAQNNTMRIGDVLQTATYISGIDGAAVDGATDSPVIIDANNKLGTTTSSRRFKYDIVDLAPDAERLHALRPVAFRYLADQGRGDSRQFGLIAEDVAAAMPELVVLKDGQPFTVRYHQLPPLLLAEVQRLERERATQATRLESLERELAGLRTLVEARDRR